MVNMQIAPLYQIILPHLHSIKKYWVSIIHHCQSYHWFSTCASFVFAMHTVRSLRKSRNFNLGIWHQQYFFSQREGLLYNNASSLGVKKILPQLIVWTQKSPLEVSSTKNIQRQVQNHFTYGKAVFM